MSADRLPQPWRSAGGFQRRLSDLDHPNGRSLQSLLVMAWIVPVVSGRVLLDVSTHSPPRRLAGERPRARAYGSEDGPQGRRGAGESLPEAARGLSAAGLHDVSSSQLGEPLSIKNAQVRKDLAFFGQFGHPGIGYRIDELIDALRHILGIDHDWPLALVGLGNLGRALLRYRGFRTRGFHVVALFDNDPAKIGQKHDGLVVEPIESLRKVVALRKIKLAILCVPAEAAQRVADLLVASGIRGILNFAPVPLIVPAHVNLVPST